jgi:Fibronectin type III domain
MAVSWVAPTLTGVSGAQTFAITGYTVTVTPGGETCTALTSPTTCTATGLTPNTAYSAVVQSYNNSGPGGTSAAGGSSDPSPYVLTVPTPPSTPTINSLTDGDGSIVVNFTDGAPNSSPITSNVVRAIAPDLSVAAACGSGQLVASPCTLSGLTDGTTYTVQVISTNAIGSSPAATATATPYTAPGQLQVAPTAAASTAPGTPSISLTWPVWGTPGAPSTGGSPVTSYKVLVWGTPYTFSAGSVCDAATCTATISTNIAYGA